MRTKIVIILIILLAGGGIIAFYAFQQGMEESLILANTQRFDTAYNVKTGVSVSLGESEDSVKAKFSEDEYEIVPFLDQYKQPEPYGRYRYVFADSDNVHFAIAFTDGKVSGLGLFAVNDFTLTSFGIGYETKNLKTDWYFKNGITVGVPQKKVDQILGMPSWPKSGNVDPTEYGLFEEHGTAYSSIYALTDDGYCLSNDEYEANRKGDNAYNPTFYAYLSYGSYQLKDIMIRQGMDPQDVFGGGNDIENYLLGTPY